MYLLIIQWSIISLILIILIHYLYSFFQTTLTIPKIKDLVNRPSDAYREIYDTIHNDHLNENKQNRNKQNEQHMNSTYNKLNKHDQTMKDELKSFLNNLNISSTNSQMNHTQDIIINEIPHTNGNINMNALNNIDNANNMNNISSFEFGNHYSSY